MYKNLHFKIIIIFIVFTVTLMSVIGAVMLVGAFRFYNNDFISQMNEVLSDGSSLRTQLADAMQSGDSPELQGRLLKANTGALGIGKYRNYYILDMGGSCLVRSDGLELSERLEITPNILSAMEHGTGSKKELWTDYIDYAVYISSGDAERIVYIRDTQEEAHSFASMIIQNITQTLFISLLVALILSFFLARAITAPIQNLTAGAQRISEGEFSYEIDVHSDDEIGKLTDTFNIMKDALKNTLDEMNGERRKFESLFLYLNDAVIAFDAEGNLMHINKTAKRLFHFTSEKADEMIRAFSFSVMIKLLRIDYKAAAEQYKREKISPIRDVMFDGKALDVTLAEFRYTENKSGVSGIMCVIHDVTGRYELDKSRREFVANVSHELRTPLTSIKGAVETVLEYPSLDSDTRDSFLTMAVEECDRMTRIVSDLLILSRLDNNRTSWRVETFDVRDFITHIYDVMNVDAKNHSHALNLICAEDIPPVTGDKEKLQQVIINIISNSVKYTPDGGNIVIRADAEPNFALITVKDNGRGVPKDDIPRLFERFYRVEKARSSDSGGTGLGLAIAKEIIDAHGGSIRIESELGEGTTVFAEIPYVCSLENDTPERNKV